MIAKLLIDGAVREVALPAEPTKGDEIDLGDAGLVVVVGRRIVAHPEREAEVVLRVERMEGA